MYVPSHIGMEGNEKVNEYAKSAENSTPLLLINPDDTKNILQQIQQSNWQNQSNSKTNYKLFLHKKTVLPWKKLSLLNRSKEIIITRLRIGRTKLTHSHLYLKNPEPICQFCNSEPTSTQQLLFFCPSLKHERQTLNISEIPPNNPRFIN